MTIAAIVLAGSHAPNGDLGSLCVPRLLMPLAQARLVDYLLDWLQEGAIRDVIICAGESAPTLCEDLGDGFAHGFRFYYNVDREPRGPAGCCRDATLLAPADRYVVVESSVLPDFPLIDVLTQHSMAGAGATVVVSQNGQSGAVETTQVPTGVYVFEARTLAAVPPIGYQDIKEMLLPRLYQQNESVLTYLAHRPSPRLLGLDAYFAVQGWLLQKMGCEVMVPPGYIRTNGTYRHDTASLSEETESIGPVLVGPGSRVARGTTLIGPVVIGRDCVVEEDCLVQRSILWDGCVVGFGAQLDRCLLTSMSCIRAGAVVSGVVCSDELGTFSDH